MHRVLPSPLKDTKTGREGGGDGVGLYSISALLKESATSWSSHNAPKMGAALAYYTAFSLAPLTTLLLSGVSLFMKRDSAVKGIVEQISNLVGADGGKVVNEILTHAGTQKALSWSTGISFVVLFISASGAFGELQDSLNSIWDVPKQKHPWMAIIKNRLLSLSMVFVLGFFMVVSLAVSAFITGLSDWWVSPEWKIELEVLNTLVSLLVISGLFSSIFRLLPDVELNWRDVFLGGTLSAVLFIAGKFVLGWYIGHTAFASTYGAAASFVVILFWTFYSAQILYFGAEFTRAYARKHGSHSSAPPGPPESDESHSITARSPSRATL